MRWLPGYCWIRRRKWGESIEKLGVLCVLSMLGRPLNLLLPAGSAKKGTGLAPIPLRSFCRFYALGDALKLSRWGSVAVK
jgi:hypothetical protein